MPRLTDLVQGAYGHYVGRLGGTPRPMLDDYAEVIRNRRVTVAVRLEEIVGLIVLEVGAEGLVIDNVAVDPSHQGSGVGRALLEHAEVEARRAGLDSIHLYTHERMSENLALYARIGYEEYDRRLQGAAPLVYLRKKLKGSTSKDLTAMNVVEPLTPAHHRAAARVLADAFLHDPGWVAVGPSSERARWRYIYRTCLGAMRVGARWCGPSWCVLEAGEPVAVLTGCGPGLWPPPRLRSLVYLSPGSVLAGPAPMVRSLVTQRIIEAAHPAYEHFLVWMFAVSPERQRSGLGRRLMGEALARADAAELPAYLWTGNPDNLPYYASHGFQVVGEARIPGGVPNWFMQRPALTSGADLR